MIAASEPMTRVPVLVELFTSEGCSSCPPADALLARLDREQPIPEADLVVLSEHVDYWNYIGWKDPFSSHAFTLRQQQYGQRFRLNSVYTPQIVVDGQAEMVGSDAARIRAAVKAAAATAKPKAKVRLTEDGGAVRIEIDAVQRGGAEVWLAMADEAAESNVTRGENSGRRLPHVAVVRSLERIGETSGSAAFSREVRRNRAGRMVVFVQEPGQGRVLGAGALLRQG